MVLTISLASHNLALARLHPPHSLVRLPTPSHTLPLSPSPQTVRKVQEVLGSKQGVEPSAQPAGPTVHVSGGHLAWV